MMYWYLLLGLVIGSMVSGAVFIAYGMKKGAEAMLKELKYYGAVDMDKAKLGIIKEQYQIEQNKKKG